MLLPVTVIGRIGPAGLPPLIGPTYPVVEHSLVTGVARPDQGRVFVVEARTCIAASIRKWR
jgi:hypothetical protein